MLQVLARFTFIIAGFGLMLLFLDSINFFDRGGAQNPQNSPENNQEADIEVIEPEEYSNERGFYVRRQNDGHFYVTARVNQDYVRFLIDTGASTVVLSQEIAEYLGYDFWDQDFDITVRTASGEARARAIMLSEINIDDEIVVSNVQAVVIQGGEVNLLGMSFLNRLDGFEVSDGQMILIQ